MATIDDFGGPGQALDNPPLGGPSGWAKAVRDAIRNLEGGGVDTTALADGAVTSAKIANDTITAAQIAANAVGSSELADNAVNVAALDADDLGNGLVLTADSGEPSGMKWSAYGIADLDIGTVDTGSPAAASMTGNPEDGYELNLTLPPVGDGSITNIAVNAAADIAPTKIAGTALTIATSGVFNVKHYGALGNAVADDTAGIGAAIAAAAASIGAHGTQRAVVHFPPGVYLTDRFTVPGRVSLHGDGYGVARLVTNETDGGHFCVFAGSFSDAVGLTFDGQRSAQSGTPIGLSTVLFARSNAVTGGGGSISGGLTLSGAVSSGATSITVTDDSPAGEQVIAGEYISLVESAKYELVRVAPTYAGGLTISLETATVESFTTAAKVSVASTYNTIRECRVLGNGRDGIAFWHNVRSSAYRNLIEDYEDTGIDFPDAGSRFCDATENHMETRGRWGVAFDTASSDFGTVADCVSRNNFIRFLPGGSFVNGNTLDGVYVGATAGCMSIDDHVDITLAGRCGVFLVAQAVDAEVGGLIVTGPATPRASTRGVQCSGAPVRPTISGGHISGTEKAVELDTSAHAVVNGVKITNASAYGVTVTADSGVAQRISVVGVHADGNVMGVRFGGTPDAGNAVSVTGCVLLNSSYQACGADGGWNLTQTGNV